MKNVWTFTWQRNSREEIGYFTSGKSKTASARSVNKRSPRSLAGKAITSAGDPKVDQTQQRTAFCFIPRVISKPIAKEKPYRNRGLQRAKERLERAYGESQRYRS